FAYFNNIPELGRYLKYGNTPPLVKAPVAEQQSRIRELDAVVTRSQQAFIGLDGELRSAQRTWEKSLKSGADWMPAKALAAHIPDAALTGDAFIDAGDKGAFGFYDRFTVSAWIRSSAPNGAILTRAADDADGEGWGLYLIDGKLQANLIKRRLDDSIRLESKDTVPLSQWHHVAMSYDGSRMANGVKLYLDGKPLQTEIILDAINQDFKTKEPLRVGGGGGPEIRFKGEIRDARVYSREAPQEEVEVLAVGRKIQEIASSKTRTPVEERKLRSAFLDSAAPAKITAAYQTVEKALEDRANYLDGIPTVMVMQEVLPPKETHILLRGAYDKPGEKVSRGVLEALHPLPAGAPQDRLGLAKWVIDPANPLTARVAVNRFWQSLFGTGIVKTAEDFGAQGEWPSHPELLDWLATEFVKTGWDIKAIHKTIVMSATYRQSSRTDAGALAKDPENRLLARGPRLRLPAEVVRDAALANAGLLVEKQGGPSVKPYQPAGVWSELGGGDYERDKGEGLYRRSLYTFWKRTAPPPYMSNFDSALRESCTVREGRTNTPLQALNLMNDVTFVEAARVLAQRTLSLPATDRTRQIFRLILSRTPEDGELTKLNEALAYYKDYYASRTKDAETYLAQGDTPVDKRVAPAELAAYTAVASLVLNLDEAVTKE
ncbi:MAG TPA: DUF1553 domain-containing protein, partial [Bryobacteraceae bacterium]|nr:DUF1553 domain-containing protein [Bryobacteraceae bacterium]